MPSVTTLASFAAVSAVLIAVPGPSVAFIIGRALALGRRAAILTVVGNTTGAYAQIVIVAVGLGSILQRSAIVFTAVKLLGAAYLVYLGVQAFRHRADLGGGLDVMAVGGPRRTVKEGFVVGLTNPKLAVFMAALLPQYVNQAGVSPVAQMLVLGLVFATVAVVLDSTWALVAGTARTALSRNPTTLRRIGGAGGLAMIGLGVQMAISGRSD